MVVLIEIPCVCPQISQQALADPKCEVVPRVMCNEGKTKQRNLLFLSSLISQSGLRYAMTENVSRAVHASL